MKKSLLWILLTSAWIVTSSCGTNNNVHVKLNGVIPAPDIITVTNNSFQFNEKSTVVIESIDLLELGELFADSFDISLVDANGGIEENGILLKVDSLLPSESYKLNISESLISVVGGDHAGVFYALQTLLQLNTENGLPAVSIQDAPRFPYRGMMLDVSRYFYSVNEVKRFLDMMAMHKFNKFHWHLTDDQGWRIQIKKYPLLTEVGSIRKETMKGDFRDSNARKVLWETNESWDFRTEFIKDSIDYDGTPHSGFYTQEQIKEIVQYASDRYIEVIPEIDVPGHSSAALAAYPEYGCKDEYEVSTRWSVHPNILCPTEETISFVEDILSEVIDLFPSEYVHIGGDEANKTHWEDSQLCQGLIEGNGLGDEQGLQSYFISRLDSFLSSRDKNLIGWDEILEGGLSPNATVMSWQGEKGGIEAAKHHHNVVMSPGSHTYFDKYQDQNEFEQKLPLAQWGVISLEKAYNYEPIPELLTDPERKFILGAQGCLWTEYIPTFEYLEYMALPRMAALSEVVWSSPENKNWENFQVRLQNLFERYDEKEYNYAKHNKKK